MNLAGASIRNLVDGDPDSIAIVEYGWERIGVVGADVAMRCELIEPARWTGPASSSFGGTIAAQISDLWELAEAMASAVALAAEWGAAVAEAQTEVSAALAAYQRGLDQRRYWLQNNEAIEAATGVPLPDTSADIMLAAERRVVELQAELDARAASIADRFEGLADRASDRYSWMSDVGHVLGEIGGGAADAVGALWELASNVSPVRLLFDAKRARDDAEVMWNGVVSTTKLAVSDPRALFNQLYDGFVDDFVVNPWRGVGEAVPDLAASFAGVAGGVSAANRRATHLLRWVDSLPEVDQRAIEAFARRWLIDLESLDLESHFVERHGPQVTRAQLYDRANIGLLPDGTQSYRTHASRFRDWDTMREAVESAVRHHEMSGQRGFWMRFDHVMGEGYPKHSDGLLETHVVFYRFADDGTLVSAFPDVRKAVQ